MIDLPSARARDRNSDTSVTHGAMRAQAAASSASTWSASITESPMIRLRASTLWRIAPAQRLGVGEVADADAAARDLVLVGRADAARGRPDLALAAPRLAQQVELAVVRQDEVRLVADDQPVADRDAGGRELVDLGEQRLRVDDHAVADDAA